MGLLVNDIYTEKVNYSTTLIAMTATNMGHEVWYISLEQLSYAVEDYVYAKAVRVTDKTYRNCSTYLKNLHSKKAFQQTITLDQLDVLMLRNDPAEDANNRPWARLAGINFGRLAMRHGVLVLNNPMGLNEAVNKMYLQYFPEEVRPRAIITRNADDIKHFIKQERGYAVLKPLSGSGGRNVFLIQPQEHANLNQIIESVSQDGFIIAQEYLQEAKNGDVRLFLLDGKPLVVDGNYAAIHRFRSNEEDMRSNLSSGAIAKKAKITPAILELAEIIRPKLIRDGMFLSGLDIVDNKLMEINVFSPGGLVGCERLHKLNFGKLIIQSLERKVEYIHHQNRHFDNAEVATF
ncbi:glutathione synthetase [Aliiglaciecola sp. LCG003]|uniref:glutathione synthetase n=1 Tax=Aliiglaciecola sp. LCG003 TaxID=3053655 RepID=UPI0025735036|nr:glutathione synthetase [Aliiglaciecola sp. LCG003]WJG09179.1 glutathione synthetase [Aliiglaciecola sp. LCG003]